MKIKNVSLTKNSKNATLSADVVFRGKKPEKIYFSTERKYESFISTDASAILAAVLLPSMKTGEDIFIDGSVSKKLLKNTKKIMNLIESWNIGLKKIKIDSPTTDIKQNNATGGQKKIASFFSAGVDSFYTYLKHKDTKDKISYLVFVHGFDIPLQNNILFKKTRSIVEKVAREEKINAIIVETNVAEVIERYLIWDFAHGGALAAVALFLGKGLDKIFIPAGLRIDEVFPYGTHPNLDKLWSSEKLSIVHDGTEHNRLGKIMSRVSKSDLALKYLHVCAQNIKGKYNCSRCYKCLQTMIELVCARSLQKAKTFDKLDLNAVKNMYYDYSLKYNLQGEANLSILRSQNREHKLQEAIEYSLINSKKVRFRKKIFQTISSWDQNHNDRRLYRFVFQLNKNQDRNKLFKLLGRMGALK